MPNYISFLLISNFKENNSKFTISYLQGKKMSASIKVSDIPLCWKRWSINSYWMSLSYTWHGTRQDRLISTSLPNWYLTLHTQDDIQLGRLQGSVVMDFSCIVHWGDVTDKDTIRLSTKEKWIGNTTSRKLTQQQYHSS